MTSSDEHGTLAPSASTSPKLRPATVNDLDATLGVAVASTLRRIDANANA